MGNCQAIDAAALVIQHPSGRIERFYWPLTANEVMKTNPGHYVALIIPLPTSGGEDQQQKTVRFTRIKILRPSDILSLGHAYRLITSQEVMKVLKAKKSAKVKKQQPESVEQTATENHSSSCIGKEPTKAETSNQAIRRETQCMRAPNPAALKSKSWRPSLQSISEGGS